MATNLQKWIHFMKKTPPGEIPSPYPSPLPSDAGKVLGVDENGRTAWVDPPGALPPITESDRNKTLVVDSSGIPTWGMVASGEIPLGENESIGIFKE